MYVCVWFYHFSYIFKIFQIVILENTILMDIVKISLLTFSLNGVCVLLCVCVCVCVCV